MKRRTKFIILFIIIATIIVGAYFAYKSTMHMTINRGTIISKNDNVINMNVDDYKYIHIIAKVNNETPYKILNPDGEVIEEGKSTGEINYFGDAKKGDWKVVLNVEEEETIEYRLWTGNLKSNDKKYKRKGV